MKKYALYLLLLSSALTIKSCSDDDPQATTSSITIEFDNIAGSSNLVLNTEDTPYTNGHGESYKATLLMYYVSSIKLKTEDGKIYEDPVSPDGSKGYYLIDESKPATQEVTLENVPFGEYSEITFTIGVDANQVSQGAQTGALDPANGLFWSWNSGYIFMALEGVAPASTEEEHLFQYHVGGYKEDAASNQYNNVRTVTLGFNGDTAPVRAQHEPEVHLLFDVNKFLDGASEEVTFTGNASRHSPAACKDLADNIPGAFVVDHVHAN